jgi:preprotein translocase subunit SecY
VVIPVPGIDLQVLGRLFGNDHFRFSEFFLGDGHALERVSIIALGLIPYFYTYMIVEILSVFIQPLKSWREEGYSGRMKLKKAALFATFLLAFWQGYNVAQGIENMFMTGEKIIRNPGVGFRLISALTLSAGTFLTIWIAELITKKGIGHGISILIFVGFGPRIFSNISQIIWTPHKHSLLEYFLLFALIVAAFMSLIVLMEKSKRKIPVKFNDSIEASIPLKLTSAGIMPADWASSLIALPIMVSGFINSSISQKLSEILFYGHIWYYIAYIMILLFLYYLFTSFFYNPKKMVAALKNRKTSIESSVREKVENEESYIDKRLEAIIPIGALYLCFLFWHLRSFQDF